MRTWPRATSSPLITRRAKARAPVVEARVDHAQDVVYTTDLEGHLTSVNEAGLKLLGYRQEELLGRSVYDLLAPEDVERVRGEDVRSPPPGAGRTG